MAKSTRQYVFEGMELLPAALIPFVEKRLETSIKGHWQLEVVQRVQGLRPNSKGEVGWDQQGCSTMMASGRTRSLRSLAIPSGPMCPNCSMSATSSRTTRPSPTTMPSARSIPCAA
jgi:hypothetical protein